MRNEPEPALAVLETVRPVLEASGNPARRFSFYMHLALGRIMRNGYRVAEADIATMRQGLAAAQEQMEQALAMAERIGESLLHGQSLLGLALIALRRHDTETVRALMTQVMAAAEAMASFEYTAGAKACLAWLAWQDGRSADVITLTDEIPVLMAATIGSGFYQGLIYLWPLIAVHLDTGNVAGAMAAGRQLLQAARPRLDGDLESVVEAASRAWDQGQPELCRDQLAAALALARKQNYC